MAQDYALTLTDAELARYRMMAANARRDEGELWTRAGIVPGATAADIGCGPGATTVELADVVGPEGAVIAVDRDEASLQAARSLIDDRGFANVTIRRGDATDTGIDAASVDAVVIRHVLAHNGGQEVAILAHAASLLRPGGGVLVVDGDLTAVRRMPPDPDLTDLHDRYTRFHAERGNDPSVGLRIDQLLADSGLDVVDFRGWYTLVEAAPGRRPPPWAARDAMRATGCASDEDIERWAAALDRQDQSPRPPTLFLAVFAAIGVRPNPNQEA